MELWHFHLLMGVGFLVVALIMDSPMVTAYAYAYAMVLGILIIVE